MAAKVNGANQIQSDFKIFLGKKSEIAMIEKEKKVEPLKWYLAWNTGEIWVGMPTKTLRQFGGKYQDEDLTDTGLSYDEIQELSAQYFTKYEEITVENMSAYLTEKKSKFNTSDIALLQTALDIRLLKKQLSSIQGDYKSFSELSKALQEKVTKLTDKSAQLVQKQVNDVLNSLQDKFITRTETIDLINNAMQNAFEREITTWMSNNDYVTNSHLQNTLYNLNKSFATTDALNEKVTFLSGNALVDKLAAGKTGVYIVSESSNLFYQGEIVNVIGKNKFTKLNNVSSSSGSVTINTGGSDPEVILMDANGNTSVLIEDGITDYYTTFKYKINNIGNVAYVNGGSGSPVDRVFNLYNTNNVNVLSNESIDPDGADTINYEAHISNPTYGDYSYTMRVTNAITNSAVDGKYTFIVRAPLFYGTSSKLEISNTEVLALSKDLDVSYKGKEYEFNANAMDYLYLAIPHYENISRFTFNGFNAPFDKVTSKYIKTKENNNILYDIYRSSSALLQGEYYITLK